MIADSVRMEAYVQALKAVAKPGQVVLDIGTGAGIFALLACQFGADRVYAIESNDAIILAQEMAQANGYADRIHFIQGLSTEVSLAEPVDAILSDLRGVLPLYCGNIPAVMDARHRFLKPGGTLIPQLDHLRVVPVHAPENYDYFAGPWTQTRYQLDMRAAQQLALNAWERVQIPSSQFVADPKTWASIHYATVDTPNARGHVEWQIAQDSLSHGLLLWFDTTLADGVSFSSLSDQEERVYGTAFFPFLEPIKLDAGDVLDVQLSATLVSDRYVWAWRTQCHRGDHSPQPDVHFDQSTFYGVPLSPAKLRRRAATFTPRLSNDGQYTHLVLDMMSQENTLETIASALVENYPERFANSNTALSYVSELSERFSL